MQKSGLYYALIAVICILVIRDTAHSAPIQPANVSQNTIKNYWVSAQKKIRANWQPPEAVNKGSTHPLSTCSIVKFTICPNGQVKDVQVYKSSGSTDADLSAVKAVKTAAPFPPITISPQNKSGVDIEMEFAVNDWFALHPSNYTFSVRLPDNAKHTNSWNLIGDIETWIVGGTFIYEVGACKFNDLTHLGTASASGQNGVLRGFVRAFYNSLESSSGGTMMSRNLVRESKLNNYRTEEYKFFLKTRKEQVLEGRSIFYVNDRFCYVFTALGPQGLLDSTTHFFASIKIK